MEHVYDHMVESYSGNFAAGDAVQIKDGIVHAGPGCKDEPGKPRVVIFMTYRRNLSQCATVCHSGPSSTADREKKGRKMTEDKVRQGSSVHWCVSVPGLPEKSTTS